MSDIPRDKFLKSFLGGFFDEWPVGLKVLNRDGSILYANDTLQELLGYSENELQGIDEKKIIHEADLYRFRRALDALDKEAGGYSEIEVRHIHEDGTPIWTELSHALVKQGESEDETYILERIIDISNLRKMRGQLFRLERSRTLGQLAGGIAHEFNNLLAIVSTNLSILDEAVSDDDCDLDVVRQTLERTQNITDRGKTLTQQLAGFGREKANSLTLLDVNSLIRKTTTFAEALFSSSIELHIELDEDVPPVKSAQLQIEQILMNLYMNARDAMPEGGMLSVESFPRTIEKPEAAPGELDPGDYAVIRVADTGVGLDEDVIEKIFEPFFTTKEHGTGVGLSIIHGIVRDGNGFIEVESAPGSGTSFTVFLPAGEPDSDDESPDSDYDPDSDAQRPSNAQSSTEQK